MIFSPETSLRLDERTFIFADKVRNFAKLAPKSIETINDIKQLIRSSGSIGANYIEGNESLGTKDCLFRFRISRKEAKESLYWLRLLYQRLPSSLKIECSSLIDEARQLVSIFSAILIKLTHKNVE